MSWDALQNLQDLHSKAHCSNHTEILHYIWQRHVLKASIKRGLKLTSAQENLRSQRIRNEHKQLKQLATQTMLEALT
jgi:hypothetical protein